MYQFSTLLDVALPPSATENPDAAGALGITGTDGSITVIIVLAVVAAAVAAALILLLRAAAKKKKKNKK